MSFSISGDTHGTIDIGKIDKFFDEHEHEYTSEDYLVVCGDIGVCGFSTSEEAETRSVFRSLPVTTLFVDGNHENFKQLNAYDVDIWNGGKVHFIENEIIHLMRGQVFEIDGTRFFTFGGAYSIDKMLMKSLWSVSKRTVMLFIKAKLKISWMLQTSIRGITGLEKYFAAFDKVIITTEKGETIICKMMK